MSNQKKENTRASNDALLKIIEVLSKNDAVSYTALAKELKEYYTINYAQDNLRKSLPIVHDVLKLVQQQDTPPHLTLTGQTLDKNGNVISEKLGLRKGENIDLTGMELQGLTTNANGGAWMKYKKVETLSDADYKLIKERVESEPLIFKPKKQEKQTWIILGCVHFPFQNKAIWNSILHLLKDKKKAIHGIILNGDYLDLRSLSEYDKDKVGIKDLTLADEYEAGLEGLLQIKKALGKEYGRIKKVYHFGNHEARYFKHIDKVLNSRYGSALQSPVEGLKLKELGYQVQLHDKDGFTLLGNSLQVHHGIYFSAQAAKAHLDKLPNVSHIFNHTHRIGYAANGRQEAFNIGWLGDSDSISFSYSDRFKREQWQNAFAVVDIDSDGNHYVQTVKCHKEGFYFGGKSY